ncbi:unnamed protein product, partial [Hymenolepis diminuta]
VDARDYRLGRQWTAEIIATRHGRVICDVEVGWWRTRRVGNPPLISVIYLRVHYPIRLIIPVFFHLHFRPILIEEELREYMRVDYNLSSALALVISFCLEVLYYGVFTIVDSARLLPGLLVHYSQIPIILSELFNSPRHGTSGVEITGSRSAKRRCGGTGAFMFVHLLNFTFTWSLTLGSTLMIS